MSISRRMITRKELDFYLYGRADVLPVKLEDGSPQDEEAKQQIIAKKIPQYEEKSVDILQLRYKPGVEKEFRSSDEFKKVLATIKSIPPQLHLCYSSIPGAGFGICATENIPSGTWIGPYEGKRVSVEQIESMLDTRYVWEIYKNGVFDHCIDGMEHLEKQSGCWMKYIQCARNVTEQNTVAFQYGADLYFQTYKAIQSGEEILVWYAEYYEQHHGIPVGVRKKNETTKTSQTATTTTDVLENAKRTISEITPTTTAAGKPQPIKSQALCKTPMAKPPTLRSNYVRRPEPPPISTGGNLPYNPSPECQSSPSKRKSLPISSGVHREKQGTSSDAVNIRTAMASQKLSRTEDLHHTTNNFKTRFWKCEHCLSKFPQKWALQVHSCPCVVTKPYLCSNCGRAYVDKGDVQSHASQCGGGRKYKCGYCGRSFLNVHILGKHVKGHSKKGAVAGAFKKKTIAPKYERHMQ